ncbi:Zinc finger MYND domain-containing protein 12 [Trichoplax sp. H2]|uniref:MYND-type domain-containing protein n=1 Tax=Trichoplax adhaerens TaxID=10228 RepID=B3RZ96_TRIAD|nr:hypothetical protein TRIADDRAFT_57374 [Trichoplax adhaerens]EDV24165.1 hypothetical protein TRIADDRAFT_57374 [Trichoplax adhaerens]RDD42417.1 Zinc finger MYND domain-containing protein 12 [Trichoplax sp. H2]|eukprot:XP_002113691.1 hypothetical protein TRIADDRAFT_57374 [Trichoplax adhaerens]
MATTTTINPLANPKGTKKLCELCQKPAYIQCPNCRVTYYCDREHQKLDWDGIHAETCQLLIPLRTPLPFSSSADERAHRERQQLNRQRQIIELARTHGQKLLFESKYDLVVPAAMLCLKFSIGLYGLNSIELVPSYLLLGEASIGLGRLKQGEDYLSQAQWTVLKTPECPNQIKSKLYRNLGLLHAAKKNHSEALLQLADDIYHSSLVYGTDHIHTSGGYFHMANIFLKEGSPEKTLTLYDRVVTVWFAHLSLLIKEHEKTANLEDPAAIVAGQDELSLDVAQEAEAKLVLNTIQTVVQEKILHKEDHELTIKVHAALAMLHYILNETSKVIEMLDVIKKVVDRPSNINSKLVESYQQFRLIVEKHLS